MSISSDTAELIKEFGKSGLIPGPPLWVAILTGTSSI